jgi:hypothetical protein
MRFTILSVLILLTVSCSTTNVLVIPANQSVEIDFSNYEQYDAQIKNTSMKAVEVAVLDEISGEQVRGFGLGIKANETVMVEKTSKLVLTNTNDDDLKVKVNISERKGEGSVSNSAENVTAAKELKMPSNREYVNFTLLNNSAKSIPLLIPNVMNPNLSPFSSSGVSLKIGQEILFHEKGKKYTLLVVDDTIEEGAEIEVSKLLKARKKELGL